MAHRESTLILLTNTYPLSRGEEFLENEIDHVGRASSRSRLAPPMCRHEPSRATLRSCTLPGLHPGASTAPSSP